jgi:hypothetical protein
MIGEDSLNGEFDKAGLAEFLVKVREGSPPQDPPGHYSRSGAR